MRPSPGSRLFRLAAGCLAATGLLGHGLAMLLVAVLAQASAEAAYVGYGVLCTADGGDAPGEPAEHPSHPLELCPVCTTFAQVTPADLPPAFLPALPEAAVLADRKSTRLNSRHSSAPHVPSSV